MTKKIVFIVCALFLVFNLCFPFASQAASLQGLQESTDKFGKATYGDDVSNDLSDRLGTIIRGFLALLGVVLVIIIIYGGFMYMTAGGKEEQTKKAKAWIVNGIIGLVIILLAYAITSFVIGKLTAKPTGSAGINQQIKLI